MSELGKELIDAIEDAKEKGLVTLSEIPDVGLLRKKLKLSQQQFARDYCINLETLKKWEQHRRTPDSISRAYLKCIARQPQVIKNFVNS